MLGFFVTVTFANIFLVNGISGDTENTKVCRHAKSARTGAIHSPNFPADYPAHVDCLYYVKAPQGSLRLSFVNFDVDSHGNCSNDYVQVYNFREWTPKLCGATPPDDIISPDGDMYVVFKTDDFESGSGWTARFSQIPRLAGLDATLPLDAVVVNQTVTDVTTMS